MPSKPIQVHFPLPVLGLDNRHTLSDMVFQPGGPQSPPPRWTGAVDVDIAADGAVTRRPQFSERHAVAGVLGTWSCAGREWVQAGAVLYEDVAGVLVSRVTGLVRRVAIAAHGGLIYVTDGAANWEIDGTTVRTWGLPVPVAVVSEGTGAALPEGRYLAQVAFVDAAGNSGGISDLVAFTADGGSGWDVSLDMSLARDAWPGAQMWLALDGSLSMENEVSPGVRRWDVVLEAINAWLNDLELWVAYVRVDVHVSIFGPPYSPAEVWENRNCGLDEIADLRSWLDAFEFTWGIGTNYLIGIVGIDDWMADGAPTASRTCLLLSDGHPMEDGLDTAQDAIAAASPISVYTMLIGGTDTQYLAMFDNTPEDGIPTLEDGDVDGIYQVLADLQADAFSGIAAAVDIYVSGQDHRETTWVARIPPDELPYALPASPITAADPPVTALMSGPPAGLLGLVSWRAFVLGWYDNVLAFSEGLEPHLWHADSFHQFGVDVRAVAALTQGLWVATADGLVWVSGDDALSVVPNYRRRGVFRTGSAVIEGSRLPMLQTSGLVALFCDDDGIVAGLESGEAVPLTAGRYRPPAGARVSFAYTERDGFRQILMGVHDA